MPAFRFICETCQKEIKKLTDATVEKLPCESCGGSMQKQLAESVSSTTMESRDKHRGVQLRKGHDQIVKERMSEHHDRYELEEKIDKHGIQDAERHKWTKKIKKI